MNIKSFLNFDTKKVKWFHKENNLVLVGTVKSVKQLDICLAEKFYYMPLNLLIPQIFYSRNQLEKIKYVSMYQSINLYKEKSGIRCLGNVESVSIVKRNEIKEIPKESKELYVLFKISEWKSLDEPIEVAESPIYPFEIFTFQNFKASRDTAELFLETKEERELYRLLKQMSVDVNFREFEFYGFNFRDYNDTLIITKDKECYLQLPMEVIREMPYSGIETVKEAMKN